MMGELYTAHHAEIARAKNVEIRAVRRGSVDEREQPALSFGRVSRCGDEERLSREVGAEVAGRLATLMIEAHEVMVERADLVGRRGNGPEVAVAPSAAARIDGG